MGGISRKVSAELKSPGFKLAASKSPGWRLFSQAFDKKIQGGLSKRKLGANSKSGKRSSGGFGRIFRQALRVARSQSGDITQGDE
jgi:hypothetical protein